MIAIFLYYKKAAAPKEAKKGCEIMQMSEVARLIIGLRAKGWTEKEINDFILWIETGDDRYKVNKD